MAPLIVLAALFVVLSGLGLLGVPLLEGWHTPLRLALAGMFLLTACAHWGRRRPDLVRMVPKAFPRPGLLVTLTGVLELLGALGLLVPSLAPWAALGLTLMLVAMFPANVHAARERLSIAGAPVPSLAPRTLIQAVFLAATVAVFLRR
ncbi:DoxX family protein [Myxococcus sp. K15C18031901]|uniref:DoxX family protein n=1 Tax=Myxococcus dinghuensis TaxID=2906761 RepID=UPI0020A7BCC3|nr:DoxX family protein [Myxococcus dinghuensis]MCP3097359.1 DoxX family protein [Myxococcus dinghuensis]